MPDLKYPDLSFAGRLSDRHEAHAAICACKVGDPLTLEFRDPHWQLLDRFGRVMGRMSKSWQHPCEYAFTSGAVGAVVHWRKSDGDERYAHYARRDTWETVLPELVFSPEGGQAVWENSSVRPETKIAPEKTALIHNGSPLPDTKVDQPIWDLEEPGKFAKGAYAKCRTWDELVTAFSDHGVQIVPKSGGLFLKNLSDGNQICKMSAVGLRYSAMIRHFGEGFPDYPNPSLTEMALAKEGNSPSGSKNRSRKRGRGAVGDEGDFDLIEE